MSRASSPAVYKSKRRAFYKEKDAAWLRLYIARRALAMTLADDVLRKKFGPAGGMLSPSVRQALTVVGQYRG